MKSTSQIPPRQSRPRFRVVGAPDVRRSEPRPDSAVITELKLLRGLAVILRELRQGASPASVPMLLRSLADQLEAGR